MGKRRGGEDRRREGGQGVGRSEGREEEGGEGWGGGWAGVGKGGRFLIVPRFRSSTRCITQTSPRAAHFVLVRGQPGTPNVQCI